MNPKIIEKAFGRKQIWEPVDPQNFKNLDLDFYDRIQKELESLGFRCIGNDENQTLKGGFEDMYTFVRTFISGDETVQSAVYHPKPALWVRCLLFLTGSKLGKVYDFETELSDGSFVVTNNAKMASSLPPVPNINSKQYQVGTSLKNVLKGHLQRVQKQLNEKADVKAVRVSTKKELWSSQARLEEVKRVFYMNHYGINS
ncbi:MAG: hypothetical protein ACSHXL_02180 [Bacteroidota bacterium]